MKITLIKYNNNNNNDNNCDGGFTNPQGILL